MSNCTEKTIRDALLRYIGPKDIRAHNMVGIGQYPHEMDVLRILRSGYAEEYEIKISASDIKAEAKKLAKHRDLQEGLEVSMGWDYGGGLSSLRAAPADALCEPYLAEERRPCWAVRIPHPIRRFYIVVPTEELAVVAESVVPTFAGLLIIKDQWRITKRRKAMDLPHSRKATPVEINHVLSRMALRYYLQYFGHENGAGRK